MMKFDKNDTTALLGTIIFHLAILLFLFYAVLTTVIPDDDGGVLVNFGNIDASAGIFEPRGKTASVVENTPAPEVKPEAPKVKPAPKEDIITQDTEETVSLTDRKKDEERKKKEDSERKEKELKEAARKEKERKEAAEQKRREEQRRQGQAIENQMAGAFGIGNADGDSQGNAPSGTGNQGSPFGNSDSGANTGTGGMGSFNLNGRSVGAGGLPSPGNQFKDEGRIVINITVDPKGNVILAEIGKGTNIDNADTRTRAIDAAKRAKFNSIAGNNNQSGTITYRYSFK